MREFHAAVSLVFEAEDIADAFRRLSRIFAERAKLCDPDQPVVIDTDDPEASDLILTEDFVGEIQVHKAEDCPGPQEEKEPWQG